MTGGGWTPWRSFTRPAGSPTVMDPALALDANRQLQLWLRIPDSARLYQLKQMARNGTEWKQRMWDFASPPSMDPASSLNRRAAHPPNRPISLGRPTRR